jgi:hypothetical protein
LNSDGHSGFGPVARLLLLKASTWGLRG